MKLLNYLWIVIVASLAIAIPVNFNSVEGAAMPDYNLIFKDRQFKKDLKCLADNIYYESGNQPTVGRMAVAFVTLNRVNSTQFKNNICDIVYEKHKKKVDTKTKTVCQFSWVCKPRPSIKNKIDIQAYKESLEVAFLVMTQYNTLVDPTDGSLYFHATYVRPKWKYQKTRIVRIDDHIFYR